MISRAVLCLVPLVAGCGGPSESGIDAGRPSDAGVFDAGGSDAGVSDAGTSIVTPEERALCTHLLMLDCTVASRGTEEECWASFVDIRMRTGPDCDAEYDAWVSCSTTAVCPDGGSGVFCPDEFTALGACAF